MRAWFGAVVIASACGTDPSVIEIYAPGAARVEVMLADVCYLGDGLPCAPGIAWDDTKLMFQPAGDVFQADRDERLLYTMPASGPLRLRLETSAGQTYVNRVVFIAFAADGTPTSVARVIDPKLTDDEQWVLHLDPNAAPITEILDRTADGPNTQEPETMREHVWRNPGGDETQPSCVAFQVWRSDILQWDRELYVDRNDHDCDGNADDSDCDPQWYQYGQQPTTNLSTSCSLDNSTTFPNACTVGQQMPLCFDSASTLLSCHAGPDSPECVPDAMCDECPLFATGCGEAAVDTLMNTGHMPYVKCDVAFSTDASNPGEPCTSSNNDTATIDLGMFGCAALALFPRDWPPTALPFAATFPVALATFSQSQQSCAMTLKFELGPAPAQSPRQPHVLRLTMPGPSYTRIDLPLIIDFQPGCSGTTHCSVKNIHYDASNPQASDGMWTCLGP